MPIIMLAAKVGEADRVAGLRLGANDYVVKPFSPLELVARVDAVLRRVRPGGTDGVLSFGGGGLVIDQAGREARLGGEPVALTRSEFDLLAALAGVPGRVFSRYELVARVPAYDYEGYERTAGLGIACASSVIEECAGTQQQRRLPCGHLRSQAKARC